MDTFYVVIAIVILLQFAGWYSQFAKVASYIFQLPYLKPIKGSELPKDYQAFHRAASLPIRQMGFKFVGVAKQRSIEKQEDSTIFVTLFFNETLNAFAWLHNAIAPIECDPALVRFQTYLDNGVIISTDNEYSTVQVIPAQQNIEQSITSDNPEEIWAIHIKFVEEYKSQHPGVQEAVLTAKQAVIQYNQALVADLDDAVKKRAVSGNRDRFYLSFKQSKQLLSSFKKRTKLRLATNQKRMSNSETNSNNLSNLIPADLLARPQADMAKLVIKNLTSSNARPAMKWITFGLSGALFCLFFGVWLSWDFVPILLGVIIFHELGHLFAMRLSGYSQTSIFFIPGLGAAAMGNSGSASYWQRLFVFYAGPIPGILLAFVLWYFFPNMAGWVLSLVMVLVILNWFNLLPFMPLDGGQAINLCFGETARFIFSWVSAIGLLLLAWALSEPVLWVVGTFALYTALTRLGVHSLRLKLKMLLDKVKTEDDFYAQGMRAMQATAYRQLDFGRRVNLLREFLEEFHMPKVKLYEKVLGFFIYLVSFLLPIILFILINLSSSDSEFGNIEPSRNWQEEIAAEINPDKSLALAIEATRYSLGMYDIEQADNFLETADQVLNDIADQDQYATKIAALKLRRFLMEVSEDSNLDAVIERTEAYLAMEPVLNNDYYEALKLSLQTLQRSENATVETLLALLEDYLKPLARNSELAALYIQYSYSVLEENKKLSLVKKAISIAPEEDKNGYLEHLAMVYLDSNQFEKSFEIYENLALNEEEYYNHDYYAWAAFQTSRYQQAIQIYEDQLNKYKDSIGGFSLIMFFIEKDTGNYFEFSVRLNQLIIADAMGDNSTIQKFYKILQRLKSENEKKTWTKDLKESLMQSLKYANKGWHSDNARAKIKVLDRYFK